MNHKITVKYQGDKPYRHNRSAGHDLFSERAYLIKPQSMEAVVTTTKYEPPPGYFSLAFPRSGICNKGLMLINSVGVIDQDYRGLLTWHFWNPTKKSVGIQVGERIGQVVFLPMVEVEWVEVELNSTERGENGFGSSGDF